MQRFASRIDDKGLINVEIIEIDETADAELDRLFEEKPEMRSIVAVPVYWSQKHGYWPNPADGWTIHETK